VQAQRAGENDLEKSASERKKEPEKDEKLAKKETRAAARKTLAERFEREQQARRTHWRQRQQQQRAALRERHQDERKHLKAGLAQKRRQLFRAAKAQHRQVTSIELALHARERALQLEQLQQQQRQERLALVRSLSPSSATWRTWLEQQAGQGDMAAQAALRGLHYQEQRKKRQQANAIGSADTQEWEEEFEGEQQCRVLTVARLRAEIDRRLQWVIYKSPDGKTQMVDQGHRIVVHDLHEDTLEAALRVAGAKYNNSITMTGTAQFRERAARRAIRLGIDVLDPDLQQVVQDEREKVQSKFGNLQILSSGRKLPSDRRDMGR
jgi:hypothetical protein